MGKPVCVRPYIHMGLHLAISSYWPSRGVCMGLPVGNKIFAAGSRSVIQNMTLKHDCCWRAGGARGRLHDPLQQLRGGR